MSVHDAAIDDRAVLSQPAQILTLNEQDISYHPDPDIRGEVSSELL